MPGSLTLYEVRNGIAVLTLNNPRRRNALSFAMMDLRSWAIWRAHRTMARCVSW